MAYTIEQINIYPVKSLAGIAVQEAEALPKGFAHDRRWMLIDGEGAMMTQRQYPAMALIQPVIEGDTLRLLDRNNPANSIFFPLKAKEGEPLGAEVWDSATQVLAPGGPADQWLSDLLGVPARLVYQPEASPRPVDERYARPDEHVSLADGFPYLLISQESLAHLNGRLDTPVPMDRFRPNIVVSGCEPHEEDRWESFTTEALRFRVAKPCGRCVMTTVDQEKGEFDGKEPLRTLSKYRRSGDRVDFGMNLLLDAPGMLKVRESINPDFSPTGE